MMSMTLKTYAKCLLKKFSANGLVHIGQPSIDSSDP